MEVFGGGWHSLKDAAFRDRMERRLDDDWTLSSIAVSGKEFFIRTSNALYCIGK